jgi:hypothetical protein
VYLHSTSGVIVVVAIVTNDGGVAGTRMAALTFTAELTPRAITEKDNPPEIFAELPGQATVSPQPTGGCVGSMSVTSTVLLEGAAPVRQKTRHSMPVLAGPTGAAYRYDAMYVSAARFALIGLRISIRRTLVVPAGEVVHPVEAVGSVLSQVAAFTGVALEMSEASQKLSAFAPFAAGRACLTRSVPRALVMNAVASTPPINAIMVIEMSNSTRVKANSVVRPERRGHMRWLVMAASPTRYFALPGYSGR